jgi:serine phosphatase RsbU (regulator of sigma subunit)
MESTYRTPHELVEGLHAGQPPARRQLHRLLEEPVARLMRELIDRHRLDADAELLVLHALHLAETTLRARPPKALATLSWPAFRAALLLQLARLAARPYGAERANGTAAPPDLPDCPAYHSETFFRPSTRVGRHLFGGDWFAGERVADGTLWVFLADVTGHGYYAYLLATALPAVWQRCWAAHPQTPPEPAELLAVMHDLVADCLPDGIYLEATLIRLGPDGQAVVVPAGGTRLLLHPARRRPDVVRLRGAWLGLRAPTREEQHTLSLGHGDEVVLATDGVFDQLDDHGGPESVARGVPSHRGALFRALSDALERSVAAGGQKDDITMVLLRRRDPAEEREAVLPFPGPRGGDVPV